MTLLSIRIATCSALVCGTAFAQIGKLEECLPIPSYGRELAQYREDIRKREALPKVEIVRVQFEHSNHLSPKIFNEISAELKANSYGPNPDWIKELENRTLAKLQEHGFFKAVAKVTTKRVGNTAKSQKHTASVEIYAGPQFRLDQITFSNGTLFSSAELRKLIPIQTNAILDVAKLRAGIDELRRLYGTKGYINFTAVPEVSPDDLQRRISINVDLDEGVPYHLSQVRVLGMEKSVADRLLAKSGLLPGKVFNSELLEKFFRDNKTVLPRGASLDHDSEISRDDVAHTVSPIFDFRVCP
ncbi:MAG: surface antigen [Acidobacteriales bacterium]|nr:surface antigen [Terriglobales bacterium]